MVGSYRGLSPVHVLWEVLKSLIFSSPAIQSSDLLNSQTEQWQAVKDAKVYCAKQSKTMILQKIDKADFSVTFMCL
jgi:hypothetical protein